MRKRHLLESTGHSFNKDIFKSIDVIPTTCLEWFIPFLDYHVQIFPLKKKLSTKCKLHTFGIILCLNLFFESNELWDAYLDVQWNSVENSNCVWAKELIHLVMGSIT